MSDSINQQLLGHLLGALEDEEEQWLETRLKDDEESRRGLTQWRRRLRPLAALRPDFEPPAGLAERTCRLVAAFGRPPVRTHRTTMGMSPEWSPAGRVSQFGWADVAAVGVVLMTALFLVVPAIDAGRFQARLAACQNGLRQFGAALTEYAGRNRSELPRLAHEGRLTGRGLAAATWVLSQYGPTTDAGVHPDVWLGAQENCECGAGAANSPAAGPVTLASDRVGDWSGTWRDGTKRIGDFPPMAQALLADAPSAVLPGQAVEYHGGRGRNFFFADGHVEFLGATSEELANDAGPPGGRESDVLLPLVVVGSR
ncbi:MAG: hypothetical protein ABFC63_06570 [Thermoguttaceae bacterium]